MWPFRMANLGDLWLTRDIYGLALIIAIESFRTEPNAAQTQPLTVLPYPGHPVTQISAKGLVPV